MAGNKARDISGLKFGRLTALRRLGATRYPCGTSHAVWECLCSCGNITRVSLYCLTTGNTRSCGCLKVDVTAATRRTHGHSVGGKRTPTWILWISMRNRKVGHDPAWDSFEQFLSDMGERPEGMTLDRIDNSLGYSKSNCRWATRTQQARNRTITKMVEFEGEVLPLAELAERYGLKYRTVYQRLRTGMTGRDLVAPRKTYGAGKFVAEV